MYHVISESQRLSHKNSVKIDKFNSNFCQHLQDPQQHQQQHLQQPKHQHQHKQQHPHQHWPQNQNQLKRKQHQL